MHTFQDVRVFATALNADVDPSVILFNVLMENDLREDSCKNRTASEAQSEYRAKLACQ